MSFNYVAPLTIERFLMSNAFVRGIMGPIGSGKSTGCIMELYRRACEQKPGPNGLRLTRWVAVRNTYRELEDTTVKSFLSWFPENSPHGSMNWNDMTYTWRFADVHCEVLFRALDRPGDIKKLLSLEATGFWFNEAREIAKALIDAATGRVGRFPAMKDGGPTWYGLILDTNPPDTDHWWYRTFEDEKPDGFELFRQPSGRGPDAENIENLVPNYYRTLMAGKTPEWIKVYVDGDYGFVQDGKPVFPEYKDHIHCLALDLDKRRPLIVGIDFGLTPAASIGQKDYAGRVRWRHELVTEHMGAQRFGNEFNAFVGQKLQGFEFEAITGDPAGNQESQADENTPFKMLAVLGIHAKPAFTNDPTIRREAVAVPMGRLIDGVPGWSIHPEMKTSRKGFMGGYRFKRIQIIGEERYHDKPDKNHFSHICEANEYGMIGAGEGRALIRGKRRPGELQVETVGSVFD